MRKLIKIIFLISPLLLAVDCDEPEPDSEIVFVNVSDRPVAIWDVAVKGDSTLSDLSFPPNQADYYLDLVAMPSDTIRVRAPYKHLLTTRTNKLAFFIFDKDTLEQVPWEQVVTENKVLKRHLLTLDSLERRNWIITYP